KRAVVGGGRGEVLVVDDDAATRELVSRQLRGIGFSTVEAEDGEAALLRARISPPALVILDLVMPGIDGFEVLARWRADSFNVPVVVLTGKHLEPHEERILRNGLTQVIRKGGLALEQVVNEAKRLAIAHRTVDAQRPPRILYVEDSAQNRDIVRRYL